jgi:LacI family transcriptional regulator/LacI family repressor for deo operon, udp, cdd, tsx, nupC, and nupG
MLNYRAGRGRNGAGVHGRSIGVLIKELENPYFAGVIAGARSYLSERGYALLVASSEREYETERRAVELLQRFNLAAELVVRGSTRAADLPSGAKSSRG